jgi:hypothetical protein
MSGPADDDWLLAKDLIPAPPPWPESAAAPTP